MFPNAFSCFQYPFFVFNIQCMFPMYVSNIHRALSFDFFLVGMDNSYRKQREMTRSRMNALKPQALSKRIECSPFFEKQSRHNLTKWNLPCLRGVKVLFLADSILASLQLKYISNGQKVMCYEELSLLELACVICQQKMTINNSSDLFFENERLEHHTEEFAGSVQDICATCNGYCFHNWKGHLLIHCGLTNLMKYKEKSFENQNLEKLVQMAEQAISKKLRQCKKVVWIIPTMPLIPKYCFDEKFCENYKQYSQILARRIFIKETENFTARNFSSVDSVNLDSLTCEKYFFRLLKLYQALL